MDMATRGPGRVKSLVAQAEQLPLLPTVVMRVLRLDPAGERYFERLLAVAEEDPTFAVRLIRLANAPSSAPARPIVTVRQAVVRLGAKECAGLVTALAVARVFVPTTAAHRNLWLHSLQVAVASRVIAGLMTGASVSPEHAYLAGLLHDIGRFVMFEGAADDLGRVDDTHWQSPQQLLDMEHLLLGYDHVQLGVQVCRRWSLPETITEVIRLHHDYATAGSHSNQSMRALVSAVQMADLLSLVLLDSPEIVDEEPEVVAAELADQCIRPEWPHPPVAPDVLAQRITAIRDEAAAIAGRLLGMGDADEGP